MRAARATMLGLLGIVCLISALNSDAASAERSAATEPSDQSIVAAASIRAAAGLDADLSYVRDLLIDADARQRGEMLGVPLTKDERDVLVANFAVQEDFEPVVDAAKRLAPDTYAGGWFDVATGTISVAFTDRDDSRLGELRKVAAYPEAVNVAEAAFTFSTLVAVVDAIDSGRTDAAVADLGIQFSGTNEESNVVDVWINNVTSDAESRIGLALGLDPRTISVHQADVVDADFAGEHSMPLGGHALYHASDGNCSAGPYGYVNGIYGPAPYLTTASHCNDLKYHRDGGLFSGAIHNPPSYSVIGYQQNSGSVDAQKMGLPPPYEYTTWAEGWGSPDFNLTSVTAAGQGTWVCHAGSNSAGQNNCGQVVNANASCREHNGVRAVNYFAGGGDSGAVVYGFNWTYSVPLAGLHEGLCASNGTHLFSPHGSVRSALGLDGWYLG